VIFYMGKKEQADEKILHNTIKNEVHWGKIILTILQILFPVLLFFFIVWSYFHQPRYGSMWHIIILFWTLFVYLTFDRISRFIIGPFTVEKEKPSEALTKEQKVKVKAEVEESIKSDKQIEIVLAQHDLSQLLSNYSFFYGRQQGLSDVIRFSDAFSGRPLRYINHFSQDLNVYLSIYSKFLNEPLVKAIEELKKYIDQINKFHKKEEFLSQPIFSTQEYVRLINNIVENFKPDNFLSPT